MTNDAGRGTEGEDVSGAILAAVRRFLRPIARLMIERQITHSIVSELLKQVMIEVARDEFAIDGRRETASRLSLLTGINRKDVKRLRDQQAGEGKGSRRASLGALLISRWTGDPDFLDASGNPRILPRTSDDPRDASFESLVFSASKDLPVRSILDEWQRQEIVSIDEEDRVRLRVESFVPANDVSDKAYFFGRNLRDHAAAGVHNLLDASPPFFDRSVFYDELSAASVEDLRQTASEIGRRAITEVNRHAHQLQERDTSLPPAARNHRMTWGAFYFQEEEPLPEPSLDTSDESDERNGRQERDESDEDESR